MEDTAVNHTDETRLSVDNLQSVLRVTLDLALRCGVSREEVSELTDEILSELADSHRPLESDTELSLAKRDFLSAMIGVWHRDQAYVDDLGEPASLPATGGAPSLVALHKYTAELLSDAPLSSSDAIDLLVKHQAIEQSDAGWRPTWEAFRDNRSTTVGVHPQLGYLSEFASTLNYNIDRPGGKGLFCTTARVSGFPKSRIAQVYSSCKDSGMNFITELDSLLVKGRADNLELKEDSATVGVCAYMFVRDPRSSSDR